MQAVVDLPGPLFQQVEQLAAREGATAAVLIRRWIEEGIERMPGLVQQTGRVQLPLIPAAETGTIQPIYGAQLDELLAHPT